ncbi:hypothetical protein Tco_0602032, partial [Tanacetum coccineum]
MLHLSTNQDSTTIMQAEQTVPTSASKSWLLFKSKKIAQVVSAWIKSKNSLVKHFEDMRLCRPSKRDESMSCLTKKKGCIPLERCVP